MLNHLLFLECSPRADQSLTTQLAQQAIAALRQANPSLQLDHMPLWRQTLPKFTGPAVTAKYSVMSGEPLDRREQVSWLRIRDYVARFERADMILLSAPMWNFGVPYVLKHYIDIVTQPGMVFTWTPQAGYQSLLKPRPALVITSSGGDFSLQSGNAGQDFHRPYLRSWLETYMGCTVELVSASSTATDRDALSTATREVGDAVSRLVEGRTREWQAPAERREYCR